MTPTMQLAYKLLVRRSGDAAWTEIAAVPIDLLANIQHATGVVDATMAIQAGLMQFAATLGIGDLATAARPEVVAG